MKLTEPGFYKGIVADAAVGMTNNALPKYTVRLYVQKQYDEVNDVWEEVEEGTEIIAYLTLINNKGDAIFHAKDVMAVFGWSGQSFAELAELDVEGTELTFTVAENEYNGKVSIQVRSIGLPDALPTGLQRISADDLKNMDANFANALKGLGGTKAPARKKASTKKTNTNTNTNTKKSSPPSRTTGSAKKEQEEEPTFDSEPNAWEEVERFAKSIGRSEEAEQAWMGAITQEEDANQTTADDFEAANWNEVVKKAKKEFDIPF